MKLWKRLFGQKKVVGYRVGELPDKTPGEVVLFKLPFIEPLLRDAAKQMAAAGAESLPKEEQIVAFAAKFAEIPQPRLHKLLDLQGGGRNLVHLVDNLQNAFSNPRLSADWAVPGYIVTLFRLDIEGASGISSGAQKCSECGRSVSTFSMHGMAGPAQELAEMMEDRALFCRTCERTLCTRCGMKAPSSSFICPGCGGEITFAQ